MKWLRQEEKRWHQATKASLQRQVDTLKAEREALRASLKANAEALRLAQKHLQEHCETHYWSVDEERLAQGFLSQNAEL